MQFNLKKSLTVDYCWQKLGAVCQLIRRTINYLSLPSVFDIDTFKLHVKNVVNNQTLAHRENITLFLH